MSFNIRTDTDRGERSWTQRKDNVIEYILEKDADILTLQEIKENQYVDLYKGLHETYDILYFVRDDKDNSEGLAILYKKTFELVDHDLFWLSETPDKMSLGWGAKYYRICVNALLRSPEGCYINVFDVHLDHQVEKARDEGLALILQRMGQDPYPALVSGDFNAESSDSCYEVAASVLKDCQKEAKVSEQGDTFQNRGDPTTDPTKIDFAFVSQDIDVESFSILDEKDEDGNYYSDHYAIETELRIPYSR